MGISSLFNISRSSLFTYQRAMSVVSNNIANANNPNYSRQIVVLGTEYPDYRAQFTFGTGVRLEQVIRASNQVTERQLRTTNTNFFSAQRQSTALTQIESFFSEPSDNGLSNLINKFFDSWNDLSVDPTSSPLRSNVIQSAQQLSQKIQSIHDNFVQMKSDLRTDAKDTVKQINSITKEIHTLNQQIYEASIVGKSANDLLDKRDALLGDLSKLVNINVNIDKNNVANVSIGGVFAVDGLHQIDFKMVEDNEKLSIQTMDGGAKANITGGQFYGISDTFSNKIPAYSERLDEIATKIFESVNNVHRKGYSNTNPSQTGIDFFTEYSNGVLTINEDILNDHNNIAVSKDGTNGNNEIALELAGLKDSKLLGDLTISEAYSNYISDVANDIQVSEQNADTYGLVLTQIQQQKMQYSGVSTDEEMMNILKYQKSYDAAAKLIKVADELLNTLINMV